MSRQGVDIDFTQTDVSFQKFLTIGAPTYPFGIHMTADMTQSHDKSMNTDTQFRLHETGPTGRCSQFDSYCILYIASVGDASAPCKHMSAVGRLAECVPRMCNCLRLHRHWWNGA